jgi:hypothetical protein
MEVQSISFKLYPTTTVINDIIAFLNCLTVSKYKLVAKKKNLVGGALGVIYLLFDIEVLK